MKRPVGVILERRRSAKRGDDGVADELLDRSAHVRDLDSHCVVEAIEERPRPLCIGRICERS